MNHLLMCGIILTIVIIGLCIYFREPFKYSEYEAEDEDKKHNQSTKFLRFYRRMNKELKERM